MKGMEAKTRKTNQRNMDEAQTGKVNETQTKGILQEQ